VLGQLLPDGNLALFVDPNVHRSPHLTQVKPRRSVSQLGM